MKAMAKIAGRPLRHRRGAPGRSSPLRRRATRSKRATSPATTMMAGVRGHRGRHGDRLDPGRAGWSGGARAAATSSQAEAERRRNGAPAVIILVVLLVVLAVIAVASSCWRWTRTSTSPSPTWSGQTVPAATQTLQNDNLVVGTTSSKTSTTAKGERPLHRSRCRRQGGQEQPGRPGRQRRDHRAIVTVPPVVGQQLTAAGEALTNAGLSYRPNYVTSNKPTGTGDRPGPGRGHHGQVDHGGQADRVGQPDPRQRAQRASAIPRPTPAAPSNSAELTVGSQTSACSQQREHRRFASRTRRRAPRSRAGRRSIWSSPTAPARPPCRT